MVLEKKVDGIKKMSKKEVEKSRKLVLNMIGEYENKNIEKKSNEVKKIDGIFRMVKNEDKQEKDKQEKTEEENKKIEEQKKKIKDIKSSNILVDEGIVDDPVSPRLMDKMEHKKIKKKEEESEVKKCLNDIKLKEDRRKKLKEIKENKKSNKEQSKILKKEKAQKEKLDKEKIRKKTLEEKERERKEKLNKKKQEKEEAKIKKENRKKERKEKIYNYVNNIKFNVVMKSKIIFKKTFYLISVSFLFVIILYYLFVICVIKFNIDNNIARKISDYFVVPAYITKDGVIDYYKYIDLEKKLIKEKNSGNINIKVEIVSDIIRDSLIKKYNINDQEELDIAIVSDKTINQVAYNRIKKIKEMIYEGEDFVKIADKYGDEKNKLNIKINNINNYTYKEDVINLKVNEISDVVASKDGYYIFKCYQKNDEEIGLSYVKINTKNLNEYLSEKIKNYKLISLVD